MIISHKHRFIFIKTSKTASTSIEIALSGLCGEEDIITPISSKDENTRQELGYRGPQNYRIPLHKYSIADWLRYLFLFKRAQFYNHMSARKIRRYVGCEVWDGYFKFCFARNPWDRAISHYYWFKKRYATFQDYLQSRKARRIKGFKLYTIGGQVVVDKVYRYEELDRAMEDIARVLHLERPIVLPERKAKGHLRGDKRHYSEILTAKEKEMIAAMFNNEIQLLKYQYLGEIGRTHA